MNLKRLAAFLWPIFALFKKVRGHLTHFGGSELQHQVNYSSEGEIHMALWIAA
jgi:transposase InsO family protein